MFVGCQEGYLTYKNVPVQLSADSFLRTNGGRKSAGQLLNPGSSEFWKLNGWVYVCQLLGRAAICFNGTALRFISQTVFHLATAGGTSKYYLGGEGAKAKGW